ncbi:hypothetical protein [Acetobacter ghanensis]|uniref:Transposase n=1 Tax=Acetobacter ghanensis TaxID=431306 RepID=A0ABX0KHN6_9PROT|nr:hypothetical protein [Acetobacter ghanensis]NHO39115.1 hypothetical protein [Acetobacter ghanensis]
MGLQLLQNGKRFGLTSRTVRRVRIRREERASIMNMSVVPSSITLLGQEVAPAQEGAHLR